MKRVMALGVAAHALMVPRPPCTAPGGTAARLRPAPATTGDVLWEPSEAVIAASAMRKFGDEVGVPGGYEDLWKWSVDRADEFWPRLMDFTGTVYEGDAAPTRVGDAMPDVEYFPNVRLNFAENLLRHGAPGAPLEGAEALVSISEARGERRWSFGELRDDAQRVRAALAGAGVKKEDAVGAYLPNVGESVVAMLGSTATGACWTSCSPDFGARAVADRFAQVAPRVLFACDGYVSAGRTTRVKEKVEELVRALPSLEKVVVLKMLDEDTDWAPDVFAKMVDYEAFLKGGSGADGSAPEAEYFRVPFSHPQLVLYSSGTTGLPKSIAHGCGNTILTHAKELVLHSDLKEGDRMLFYTTCGWMMWNWAASSLLGGAAVVCFDGFAAYPNLASPWDVVERERITHLGSSPRYFQACRQRVVPKETHDLGALRVIFSTGSPLMNEDFDYVYTKVKEDVLLASISGGTDICSCFALGSPTLPVVRGELQCFGLGLNAAAMDRETGKKLVGEKGELVCDDPFVAAPVLFFGDDEKKSKMRSAYFDDGGKGRWYHGDLVEVTGTVGAAGGLIIHGRSDTTLKPGGVRIGTAEVYRFAEEHPAVADSLVIGDKIKTGKRAGDVRIVLFVKLVDGTEYDAALGKEIQSVIRSGASDAHVPAIIVPVAAIPYTRSGKKVELAVRDLIAGTEPKNVGALSDPAAFDEYRALAATWKS